jgi:hypothetical protein
MNLFRIGTTVVSAFALAAISHTATAGNAQFYRGKLTGGATFTEEGVWETTTQQGPTIYKGKSKTTLNISAQQNVEIVVIGRTVSVGDATNPQPISAITANFDSDGTMINPGGGGSDHGIFSFGGGVAAGSGTAHITVIGDFSTDGDNLSIFIGSTEPMAGTCKDDKFGNQCQLNPAGMGTPHLIDSGEPPTRGRMALKAGGAFLSADSTPHVDPSPTSKDWKALICHGSLATGWSCGFSGSKVYKYPGYSFTERVQMNAKISLLGSGKW